MEKSAFHSGICRLRQARRSRPRLARIPQNGRISRQYRGGEGPHPALCRRRTFENAARPCSEPSPYPPQCWLSRWRKTLRPRQPPLYRGEYTISFLGFPVARVNFDSRVDKEGYSIEGRGLQRGPGRLLLRHERQAHRIRGASRMASRPTVSAPNTATTRSRHWSTFASRTAMSWKSSTTRRSRSVARTGCRSSRPTSSRSSIR